MDLKDQLAFPYHTSTLTQLTKREFVATMAMQGLLANYQAQVDICKDPRYDGTNFSFLLACNAVDFTDALLKQLEP